MKMLSSISSHPIDHVIFGHRLLLLLRHKEEAKTSEMVAVLNKDMLSWYLITVKLNETVQANLPKSQPTPTAPLFPAHDQENAVDRAPALAAASPSDSEWVISIRDRLDRARQDETSCPWAKFCIYRIPKSLLREDDEAYVPQVVSIGPYHHGKRRLRDMERHKWRALHHVLNRTGHRVEVYLDAVKAVEDKARACYEGHIGLSSNEFAEVMVLDGIFVLELFGYSRNDPIFSMCSIMHSIQRDMIKLENQIPLFVLDRLLGLQICQPEQCGLVSRLSVRFFDPLMPTDEPLDKKDRTKMESSNRATVSIEAFDPFAETGLHCLDVFRRSLLRSGPKPVPRLWLRRWSNNRRVVDKRRQQLIHCVTELQDAGIKFRKRKTDRFWDIDFKDGVVRIPRLLIHDGSKSLFLNLIAFEQCHADCSKEITSYVIFMDNMINSAEDVAYLHYRGIIEHWLGNDDEVANLFNKLCQEVVFDFDDSYLSGLSEKVNRYYNQRWNTWRATLRHKYFSNPWAVLSLIAAVVLLALTMAQTFYSVYAYYRPPS